MENHKTLFKCSDNNFPVLLTKLLRGEVCIETLIIMDRYIEFVQKWNINIHETYLWPSIKTKLLKYKPFVKYDTVKFKQILLDTINEHKA